MRRSTCLRTVLPFLALGAVACGGQDAAPTTTTPKVVESPAPVLIPDLSLRPGCFAPVVQLATCDTSTCTNARAQNLQLEADAKAALEPYMQMVKTIARNPVATDWTFSYEWPSPSVLASDYTVTPKARGEAGVLELSVHDHGTYQPTSSSAPQQIDGVGTMYATYTPNFALVDLETAVVRWTEHVVSLGALFRGCDPKTSVSFDARWDDEGSYALFCWDDAGHLVDCDTVDLWPH